MSNGYLVQYSYFRTERDYYYEKRAEAIAQPTQKCSLIVDGMDQSKTDIPHFKGWKKTKVSEEAHFILSYEIFRRVYSLHLSFLLLLFLFFFLLLRAQYSRFTFGMSRVSS